MSAGAREEGSVPGLSSRALLQGRVLRAPQHTWGAQWKGLAPSAQPLLSLTKV